MKKYIITLFLAGLIPGLAFSQNANDALRFSQQYVGGSARYMAMGGAFGALGGDFTVLSTNPAGLGIYKSSELLFTPSVHTGSSKSFYNGYTGKDSRTNFAAGNSGYVYAVPLGRKSQQNGFRYFQFATGINRQRTLMRTLSLPPVMML